MSTWDTNLARQTYRIMQWGDGYFDINDKGHLVVRPDPSKKATIDLYKMAEEIRSSDVSLPVLVRFTDILHHRVNSLHEAFANAMKADDYNGHFHPVYPIKVNQQHHVVEEIIRNERVGMEAGSKPELMAVLAMLPKGGVIVCNGHKDREYIRLALIGQQIGQQVFIVIEKPSELKLAIEESRKMNIQPQLGIRVRLASIGSGKWQNTGGEKSKFGLSAAQILEAVSLLKNAGMQDSLKLLHFHLGSQIANISDIQRGVREAARFYAELRNMGIPVEYMDAGGGLGVDYEGSRSRSFCSMNYSLQEYAKNLVHTLWEVCEEQSLPHPNIITESGRAMTAHHAMMITNVLEVDSMPGTDSIPECSEDDPVILQDMHQELQNMTDRPAVEIYHDAVHWMSEAQAMYTHGVIGLEQRARAEHYYFALCRRIRSQLQATTRTHHEIMDELDEKLADKYICNISVFQSLPDVWAIDQIFPVMPLHRLNEAPKQRGVIHDITCDSDGRMDHYVDMNGIESTLPLHELKEGEPYLLGFFMVGAYQEILGDMHNLFGDTDSINVEVTDSGYRLVEPLQGDTVDEVLRYVHLDPERMLAAYRDKVAKAAISDENRHIYIKELEEGLAGYTYMEE